MSSPTNISISNDPPSAFFTNRQFGTGIFIIIPGLMILFGRPAGNLALLKTRPTFVPIQFITVLGIFLFRPRFVLSLFEINISYLRQISPKTSIRFAIN